MFQYLYFIKIIILLDHISARLESSGYYLSILADTRLLCWLISNKQSLPCIALTDLDFTYLIRSSTLLGRHLNFLQIKFCPWYSLIVIPHFSTGNKWIKYLIQNWRVSNSMQITSKRPFYTSWRYVSIKYKTFFP